LPFRREDDDDVDAAGDSSSQDTTYTSYETTTGITESAKRYTSYSPVSGPRPQESETHAGLNNLDPSLLEVRERRQLEVTSVST
jgi:hypothetical protein